MPKLKKFDQKQVESIFFIGQREIVDMQKQRVTFHLGLSSNIMNKETQHKH